MPSAYHSYTDAELLRLIAGDDVIAFETLYERYWASLYQSAFSILRDREAGKDIVQNIFIWLWEHRHSVEVRSVAAYLKAAVQFKVANYLRSGRIRDTSLRQLASLSPSHEASDAAEMAELLELQSIIQTAVDHLPQKCREIYLLSRDEQLSNREIAERLGLSIKTVENQMTIALHRIRKALG